MKKIFRNMAYALLGGLMLGACSAEEFSGANGELPDIVDYADKFNIAVDQETNTAKFSFDGTSGVTPVWVIDGAYSSEFNLSDSYGYRTNSWTESKKYIPIAQAELDSDPALIQNNY